MTLPISDDLKQLMVAWYFEKGLTYGAMCERADGLVYNRTHLSKCRKNAIGLIRHIRQVMAGPVII